MKEVNIKSIIINSEEEQLVFEKKGKYNIEEKTLEFFEDELFVKVQINKNEINIIRKNDDYDLNLKFRKNKRTKNLYNIKSLGLEVELEVLTKQMELNEKSIFIEYDLFNTKNEMGTFEYKLMFWE